jgi:hypothetical protein
MQMYTGFVGVMVSVTVLGAGGTTVVEVVVLTVCGLVL